MKQTFNPSPEMEALLAQFQPVQLKRGAIVNGTVVGTSKDGLWVSTGGKSDCLIHHDDAGDLKVGDSRMFYVASEPDECGAAFLSMKKAESWTGVMQAKDSQSTEQVTVRQLQTRRGSDHIVGAVVEVRGLRGFAHVSELSARGKQLKELKGKTIQVKVLEADPNANSLLVSEKQVSKEVAAAFFATAKPGDIVRGTVSSIGKNAERSSEYGAFIDLGGGVFGLLHKSEISSNRNVVPSSVLTPGQELDVVILNLDAATNRVSLSLKGLQMTRFLTTITAGQLVEAPVARKTDFGIFFSLADGVDGLLFNWDMDRSTNPATLNKGDVVRLKIKSIEGDKIALTTKQLN
jgi:small subunit ribosomal protein S1